MVQNGPKTRFVSSNCHVPAIATISRCPASPWSIYQMKKRPGSTKKRLAEIGGNPLPPLRESPLSFLGHFFLIVAKNDV